MADVQAPAVLAKDMGAADTPKGVVLKAKGTYTVPASGAPGIGDKVEMVPVPKGAEILDISVQATGGTTNLTLSVGDDSTPARFASAKANAAATFFHMDLGLGYKYTAEDTIDITFNVAAPTATHVYTMEVLYSLS